MKRKANIPTSMKHSRSKFLALWLFGFSASLLARPQLNDLDILVRLSPNGDAHITETRQMSIDDEGTECYITLGNLHGSDLCNYQVTDETGQLYDCQEQWDIHESRHWKTGRCGIISKHDGYELCWGLGEEGQRTYVASYTVTGLLRGYADADGFNYMFVAQGINPYPAHVRLTIVADLDTVRLSDENTDIWAFRYRGDIHFQGDSIVAESSEPFGSESAMVVMCRFRKGLFQPEMTSDSDFEAVRHQAFEGSDYEGSEGGGNSFVDTLFFLFFIFGFFVFPLLVFLLNLFFVWRARRKVNKDLLWYRDIPLQGDLQQANDIVNAYRYFGADYNNLLSACILKLIHMGSIGIEQTTTDSGKSKQNFVIKTQPSQDQPRLLTMVYDIFRKAAGDDSILEPKELRRYMKSRFTQSVTDAFITTLHTKTSISQYQDRQDEVRQVFGLRKFLQEFTLLDERGINEVGLWKDYIIYATLFGVAERVISEMKRINPEYFDMDQIAHQMADEQTLPMIYSTMHSSTTRAAMSKADRVARASGSGGSASWSGGGGFSGGGFGGGIR